MKKLVLSFMVIVLFLWMSSSALAACPAGMVSYWKFDEGSGITISDSYDNNPGTISDATWSTGIVGNALDFDGVDDYVEVPSDPGFNLSSFTLEAWVKFNDTGVARIISRPSDGNPTDGYSFFSLTVSNGKISGGVQGEGQSYSSSTSTGTYTFNDDNWHLCSFVRDVQADKISIYVDGVLRGSYPDSSPGDMEHNYNSIFIGSLDGTDHFFKGLIDEAAIYNRTLTETEITEHYNNGLAGKGYCEVAADQDGDGIPDAEDNCPNDYNPDQSDSDSQDGGDVCDACPIDETDTCDTTESASANINEAGGTIVTSSGNAALDISANALSEDTSLFAQGQFLSMNDSEKLNRPDFEQQTGGAQPASLVYTFGPEGTTFSEPVTITIKYDDAGIDESTIDIYFFNTTTLVWEAQSAVCDTVLNECILTVDHFSPFIVGGTLVSVGVSCGDTIITDTTMNSDLSCSGTALTIGASHITLDCNGHSISGSGSQIGILSNGKVDVTIKNCNVNNFTHGIRLESTIESHLINNTLNNNSWYGFGLIGNSYRINLANNTANNNGFDGFILAASLNNNFNTLTSNTANDNRFNGFSLQSADYTNLTSNTANGNYIGFELRSSSTNNILKDNRAQNNSYGISLTSDSNNNLIYNNFFENAINAKDAGSNTWNTAKTVGTNIINGSFLGGNFWSDYAGIDMNGDGLGDTLLPYNSNGNISTGGDFLPLTSPAEEVSCGFEITKDTTLDSDLSCSDTALTIVADNIVLDCDGHVITGTGMGVGILAENRNFVTIKNCTIRNFSDGVKLDSTNQSMLLENTAQDNAVSGFYILKSNENTLLSNTAYNNVYGFMLSGSSDNILTSNTANNNGNYGFFLSSSSGNTLTSNIANDNNKYGFNLDISSSNILTSNTANNNDDGFRLRVSSYNKLTSNTANNNNNTGFHLKQTSIQNRLSSNRAENNKGSGFWLDQSDQNRINSSIIKNNSLYGIELWSSNNNFIYNNFFNNTANAWDNGNNAWNHVKTNGTNIIGGPFIGGNFWNDYVGADTDGDGLGNTQLPYNSNGNIQNGGDFLPLTSRTEEEISCGFTVEIDTTLDSDLSCSDTALIIGADDITLDCNGHSITGNGAGGIVSYGVLSSGKKNITIKNCVLQNFTIGIRFGATNQSYIINNTAINNSRGFVLSSSPNNVLTSNTANNNSLYGFYLYISSGNTLTSNNAESNSFYGFYLDSSFYNILSSNMANNNKHGGFYLESSFNNNFTNNTANNNIIDGFRLFSSYNNIFTNNTIKGFNNRGFFLHTSSNNNTIASNIIENNIRGISLSDSNNNLIYNNYFNNTINAQDGGNNFWNITKTPGTNIINKSFLGGNFWHDYIGLDDGSGSGVHSVADDGLGDMQLPYNSSGNIVNGGDFLPLYLPLVHYCGMRITQDTYLYRDLNCTSDYGIKIGRNDITLDCQGHTISRTSFGGRDGIYSSGKHDITIKNCVVEEFDAGIYLYNTYGSTLINNKIITSVTKTNIFLSNSHNNLLTENSGYFRLYYSDGNNLTQNDAIGTGGFSFYGSDGNTVDSNIAIDNGRAFNLKSSDDNIFTNNIIEDNYYGFYMYGTTYDNVISSNIIQNNQIGVHVAGYNNDFFNNLFINNGINARDVASNHWNTSKTAGTNILGGLFMGGNLWDDYEGVDTTGDFIGDTDLPHDSSGEILSGGDYLPLIRCGNGVLDPEEECDDGNQVSNDGCSNTCELECGGDVRQSVILSHDITGCTTDGLEITQDDVVLDCDGHSIIGSYSWRYSGPQNWIGIMTNRDNVTIKNCIVSNFSSGIQLINSDKSLVMYNIVYGTSDGISFSGNNGVIRNNKACLNPMLDVPVNYYYLESRADYVQDISISGSGNTIQNNMCDADSTYCDTQCPSCYNEIKDDSSAAFLFGLGETGRDCGGNSIGCAGNKKDCCVNGYQDAGSPQYEEGIDCGPTCPVRICIGCYESPIDIGDAGNADLMSLGTSAVYDAAIDALEEYADNKSVGVSSLNTPNEYMEAVAWYVEEHMKYQGDDIFQNEQDAKYTIEESGDRGCGKDFCGDCEDHAILRTALMRRLGVSWYCVYNVDHYTDFGGHTFNHVFYKNKWRIMDYGELGSYFRERLDMHTPPSNVWNDHLGVFWCHWSNLGCTTGSTDPKDYTRNYVGGVECPSDDNYWYNTYYTNECA